MIQIALTTCSSANDYVDVIGSSVAPDVVDVLETLRSITDDEVPIFHMGYPDPLRPRGNCVGMGLVFDREQRWLSETFLKELNDQLHRAALQAGVNFVDPRAWFEGFSICSDIRYANGIRLGNDGRGFEQDTFHPTVAGYSEMFVRFGNLHLESGALATITNPVPVDVGLASSTGTSSITAVLTPDDDLIGWDSNSGYSVSIQGLADGTQVALTQFSVPTRVATGEVGPDGTLELIVDIAQGTPGGFHTVEATADNDRLLAAWQIEVMPPTECVALSGASDGDGDGVLDSCDLTSEDGPNADPDGDGISNSADNCPLVANPGQASSGGGQLGDACALGTAGYDVTQASTCDGLTVTIDLNTNGGDGIGTSGDDVILGTPGADSIDAGEGNDTVCAGDGDDIVVGGTGDDIMFGGAGRDVMRGNAGVDRLEGEAGNDRLLGGIDGDTLIGGDGDDYLGGFGGADTIDGGPGDETIFGGFGADTINGGPGNDVISGLIGNDTINGGDGNDILNGDRGKDTINGGNGNDTINGGNSDDILNGAAGDDSVNGGKADDTLDGGTGFDVCSGNKHFVTDTTINCETVFGVP